MTKMLAILSSMTILSANFISVISCETEKEYKKDRHLIDDDWAEGRWNGSNWDDEEDNKEDDKNDLDKIDSDNTTDQSNVDNKDEEQQGDSDTPVDPEAPKKDRSKLEEDKKTKNKDIYILDLNDKQQQLLDKNRGWAGTLLKGQKARTIFENELKKINREISTDENEIIEKFTNAMQFKASEASTKKFNVFMQHKAFASFKELCKQIDEFNKEHPKQYLDVPLELFRDLATNKSQFEEAILKAYNTISNFFGKDYGFRMINALTTFKSERGNRINGQTSTGIDFKIRVSSDIVARNEAENEWISGSKSTRHLYKTFVHEIGHVVFNFHKFTNLDRVNTWLFSGLNNEFSKNEFFNQEKKRMCEEFQKEQQSENKKTCKYREANVNTPVSEKYYKIESAEIPKDGIIDQNEELKKFLIRRVKNLLNFPNSGREISVKKQFIDDILVPMFTKIVHMDEVKLVKHMLKVLHTDF